MSTLQCYEINHITKFIFLIIGKLIFQKFFGGIIALDFERPVVLFISQKTKERIKEYVVCSKSKCTDFHMYELAY